MGTSTQYWANYIKRKAEDAGWIEKGSLIMEKPYYRGWICTTATRLEYLHEEVYTALTHEEPKLAFRALLQAKETAARMMEAGQGHSLHDAIREAQYRVECLLGFNN